MVDRIIERIENGGYYTIATSMYEQYYWFEDGKFYTAMENGVHEPRSKSISEDKLRSDITRALMSPEKYDAFFEEFDE